MERAGRGVVEAILAEWPEVAAASADKQAPRALVLCGPGNNGGDGFVIARLLLAEGWQVDVVFFGDVDRLPPDARLNHDRWLELGVVTQFDDQAMAKQVRGRDAPDVVIDALFGIGLSRDPAFCAGTLAALSSHECGCKVVAVDIPTGLNSDTGAVYDHALKADLTVTFHKPKIGHEAGDGPHMCGHVVIKDIGL